jgi:hypothetical protein
LQKEFEEASGALRGAFDITQHPGGHMQSISRFPLVVAFLVAGIAAPVSAAEMTHPPMHMQGMPGMPMQGMPSMPMQGMMGQQGMMCPMMSGGMGMMGRGGLPTLPPGNEKLQLQMHAEIMQKVGEIMAKYAAQIQSR